jgi:hypothetical protein
LAVDTDFAAHALDQLLADGQPQAGAAEAARHRGIRLGEFLKHAFAHTLGHANAGVGHFEMKRDFALRVQSVAQLDRHL